MIDLTLEQRFLVWLSSSKTDLAKWCTKLNPEFFPTIVEQDICTWLCEHYAKFHTIPSATILKHLMLSVCENDKNRKLMYGRYEAVIQAIRTNVSDDKDSEWIRFEFIGWLRQQSIKWTIAEAEVRAEQNEFKKKPDSARELVKNLRNAINIVDDREEKDYMFFESVKNRVWPKRSDIAIPTGFRGLDTILRGGLIQGELMVIESGPKGGKSTVLVNMAVGAMQRRPIGGKGLNVAYYTLELSTQQVSDRFEARISGIKKEDLEHSRADVEQSCAFFKNLQKCNLLVKKFDGQVTVDTIASHLDTMEIREEFKADLVIVDYADLMRTAKIGKGDQIWAELASIYRDLRSLAGEKQFLCFTASQANRGAYNKELIDIADIAGSYEKAAIADLVVSLTRTKQDRLLNMGKLYIAAAREAEGDQTIPVRLDLPRCLIEEVESSSQ